MGKRSGMLLLAIDTAGPACAVALARDGGGSPRIVARTEEVIGRGHAERLMPMIEALLLEAALGFDNLDRIAVTTGPGSFTGIRVGVAAARGLALALEIPAVGVGSLDALAYPIAATRRAGTVIAVLDARRGEVYALARDLASGASLIEAGSMRPNDVALRIGQAKRPLILAGSGAPPVAAALGEADASIASTADFPDISDVAALGLVAEAGTPPVPHYVRGADAKPQADKVVSRR